MLSVVARPLPLILNIVWPSRHSLAATWQFELSLDYAQSSQPSTGKE